MSKHASIGQAFSLLAVLANNTEWDSIEKDVLQRFMDNPTEAGSRFTAFLKGGSIAEVAAEPTPVPENRMVTTDQVLISVNFSCTLPQMIQAGEYDWVSDVITAERFLTAGEGTVEFEGKLFKFGADVSSEAAIEAVRKADEANQWKPAKIEHLLAFGKMFPDKQREFPILALGSVCEVRGKRYVPCLGRFDTRRNLSLNWREGSRGSDYRFLAVRKVSQTPTQPQF